MTRLMTIAAVGALTVGLGACKQNEPAIPANESMNIPDSSMNNMATDSNMAATNMAAADTTTPAGFAAAAAASDMYEIAASKMALTASKTPAVKSYAQMMIDQHTQSTAGLKSAIAGVTPAVTLPTVLPAEQQTMLDGLKGKTGADFDRAYLADQKTAHDKALATMNGYAAAGAAGPLKDFATKTATVVQKHIDMLAKIKA